VTACRLGDFQATIDLLDRGADASIRDHSGCLPLHWLCMFDDQHVELVALRLTQDWGLQYIDCKSSRPTVPDVQFPLVLHGTALSFAVATCSTRAVKTLLALDVDPTCGFDEDDAESGERSVVTIAVCLHVVYILGLFWPSLYRNRDGVLFPPLLASLPCALPRSSMIERHLTHGEQRQWAM
jgi:hypothetical protein